MKVFTHIGLVSMLFGLLLPASVRAQAVIRGQGPCTPIAGASHCLVFTNGTAPIPEIRSFTFTAPRAGRASVSFHGALYCLSEKASATVVDLVSQIVTSATAVPTLTGPSGLRHAILFEPGALLSPSDTFNLASTRVVDFSAAGTRTFRFKIARLRMDAGTLCYVYNAAFTVVFAP